MPNNHVHVHGDKRIFQDLLEAKKMLVMTESKCQHELDLGTINQSSPGFHDLTHHVNQRP